MFPNPTLPPYLPLSKFYSTLLLPMQMLRFRFRCLWNQAHQLRVLLSFGKSMFSWFCIAMHDWSFFHERLKCIDRWHARYQCWIQLWSEQSWCQLRSLRGVLIKVSKLSAGPGSADLCTHSVLWLSFAHIQSSSILLLYDIVSFLLFFFHPYPNINPSVFPSFSFFCLFFFNCYFPPILQG